MTCLDCTRQFVYLIGDSSAEELAHARSCPDCTLALARMAADFERLAAELCLVAKESDYDLDEARRAVATVAPLGKHQDDVAWATVLPATDKSTGNAPAIASMGVQSTEEYCPQPGEAGPAPILAFLAPPQGSNEIGRLGNDYRVLEVLGQGGMGIVLRAEEIPLGRQVALKVMRPDVAAGPRAGARFLREARMMAAVDHERVVTIHGVGEVDGVPYLVMPLLRGQSLQARLRQVPPLSVADAVRIGREIAEGLAAAHAKGLVHRDIKPANVWLRTNESGDWNVLVLDFGLARPEREDERLTSQGILVGTPAYMAPEQAGGDRVDERSDLFSLGCVLYQLLTGHSAFAAPNVLVTLSKLATHDPTPPHQVDRAIPRPLSDFVLQLLAKQAKNRPASALAVVEKLKSIESDLPGATRSIAPAAKAPDSRSTVEVEPQPAFAAAQSISPTLGRKDAAPSKSLEQSSPLARSDGSGRRALPQRFGTGRLQSALAVRWRRWAIGSLLLVSAAGTVLVVNHLMAPAPVENVAPNMQVQYRGQIDVMVERTSADGAVRLLQLNEANALPLRKEDKFRIECRVDPPAYLYAVWIDPEHDVTPVYPWNAKVGWGSRPAKEERAGRVSLPPNAGNRYTAPDAKAGVATMVLFARPTPLDITDLELKGWLESLDDLPLPLGGEQAAVWFDNYVEVRDPDRLRTFGEVGAGDPFARWQGQLQRVLGDKAAFQTAVSFARTSGK